MRKVRPFAFNHDLRLGSGTPFIAPCSDEASLQLHSAGTLVLVVINSLQSHSALTSVQSSSDMDSGAWETRPGAAAAPACMTEPRMADPCMADPCMADPCMAELYMPEPCMVLAVMARLPDMARAKPWA